MKISTKLKGFAYANLLAMLMMSSGATLAAENSDAGKSDYDMLCASCHGKLGKGDGPLQSELMKQIPDLTVLTKNNNGVFPFDRVIMIIDGRQRVKAHGPRDMPVWGNVFSVQTSIYNESITLSDAQAIARSRLLSLTEYLSRLQAK